MIYEIDMTYPFYGGAVFTILAYLSHGSKHMLESSLRQAVHWECVFEAVTPVAGCQILDGLTILENVVRRIRKSGLSTAMSRC